MVRDTVGADTVAVVVDAGLAVCADASAAAKTRMNRDRGFTLVLDLGEIESFLIFSIVWDTAQNAKNRKGCDFGNKPACPVGRSHPGAIPLRAGGEKSQP